jgi:hypothetical protein
MASIWQAGEIFDILTAELFDLKHCHIMIMQTAAPVIRASQYIIVAAILRGLSRCAVAALSPAAISDVIVGIELPHECSCVLSTTGAVIFSGCGWYCAQIFLSRNMAAVSGPQAISVLVAEIIRLLGVRYFGSPPTKIGSSRKQFSVALSCTGTGVHGKISAASPRMWAE